MGYAWLAVLVAAMGIGYWVWKNGDKDITKGMPNTGKPSRGGGTNPENPTSTKKPKSTGGSTTTDLE